MDKGIRKGVVTQFAATIGTLPTVGGKAFRRALLDWTVEQYGCTMNAAATHYNFAFQQAKKATPASVAGLGRAPEKNNGGRKKKVEAPVNAVLANMLAAIGKTGGAQEDVAPAADFETAQQYKDRMAAELAALPAAPEAVGETFIVKRAKDGEVIAQGLSREAADALVAKAKSAKKATLVVA